MSLRIAIGSDHAALDAKTAVTDFLRERGAEVLDVGTHSRESCDYPDFAAQVCDAIVAGEADLGILLCGSGIGMSMAANRRDKIRAALCANEYMARMARAHNNANVLCLGARVLGPDLLTAVTAAFLDGRFEGGRHARRVAKFSPDVTG